MDGFEDRDAIVISENEVKFFIHNNMLEFMFLTSFEFIDSDLSLFGEDDFDLFFWKFGPFYETCSQLFDCGFAGHILVTCSLYLL